MKIVNECVTQFLLTSRNNMIFLELEFKYWQDNHNITVYKNGKSYSMFRYNCEDDGPRPESYFEDKKVLYKFLIL